MKPLRINSLQHTDGLISISSLAELDDFLHQSNFLNVDLFLEEYAGSIITYLNHKTAKVFPRYFDETGLIDYSRYPAHNPDKVKKTTSSQLKRMVNDIRRSAFIEAAPQFQDIVYSQANRALSGDQSAANWMLKLATSDNDIESIDDSKPQTDVITFS